jgi:hypothetical protein
MFERYRQKIKYRPKKNDWIVQLFEGNRLLRIAVFPTCNGAFSYVEQLERAIIPRDLSS